MTQARVENAQSQCIKQKQAILNIQIKELRLKANETNLKNDLEQLVKPVEPVLIITGCR